MLALSLVLALTAQDSAAAGGLVVRARAARERNERLVTSYTATVTQRMGVGIHALSRDRMLFHQELAARIAWQRDAPSRIEVIGARQAVPVATRGDQVPDDLDDNVRWLVINPGEDYLRLIGMSGNDGFVYPLAEGSERDYRFAAGDTTIITLPTGRDVRLLELKVSARRPDFRLVNGSLWFDADSYGLVRAVFRPARPYEFRRDADAGDREGVPAFVNPIGEVKFVTMEYGLYESRWWMLRYVSMDAVGSMGSMLGIPFKFERTYSDYRVQGGTPPVPGGSFRSAGTVRRRERSAADSARAEGRPYIRTARDSILADSIAQAVRECIRRANEAEAARDSSRQGRRAAVRVRVRHCTRRDESDSALVVVIPDDTASLMNSPALGAPILEMGDVISEGELNQLGQSIGLLPQRPWEYRPDLPVGVGAVLSRLRYNRVEALSLGWGGKIDFGRLTLDGVARIGVADWEPNFELGLTRPTSNARFRLGGYRRLAAANPDVGAFGLLASASAFFLGRDDGEYFRSLGAELTGRNANSGWWSWRIYAERQDSASVGTRASVAHFINHGHLFRPNIAAQPADEAGTSLAVRGSKTLSRTLRLGGDATADGATGDYDFGRGATSLHLAITPGGPLAFAAEAAAGTSTGTVPVQSQFYLGGPATLRGYDGGVTRGPAFWRGRLEVGNAFPAFRLTAYTDAGWAGSRANFTRGRPLLGAGVGLSILDGLIRMDLSRGLRAPVGWRFDFYFDGAL
jgi:hypothetical protein